MENLTISVRYLPPPDIFTGAEKSFLSLPLLSFRGQLLLFTVFTFLDGRPGRQRVISFGDGLQGRGGGFVDLFHRFGRRLGGHLLDLGLQLGNLASSGGGSGAALVRLEGGVGELALAAHSDVEAAVSCSRNT